MNTDFKTGFTKIIEKDFGGSRNFKAQVEAIKNQRMLPEKVLNSIFQYFGNEDRNTGISILTTIQKGEVRILEALARQLQVLLENKSESNYWDNVDTVLSSETIRRKREEIRNKFEATKGA